MWFNFEDLQLTSGTDSHVWLAESSEHGINELIESSSASNNGIGVRHHVAFMWARETVLSTNSFNNYPHREHSIRVKWRWINLKQKADELKFEKV